MPARLGVRLEIIEVKQAGLAAGVGVEPQGIGVFPADAQSSRYTHDAARPIRSTRVAVTRIGEHIPLVGDVSGGWRQRDTRIITSWWRHHAPAPVLGDDRYPLAR